MSFIVCIFNILELNNRLSENIYVINYVNCITVELGYNVIQGTGEISSL
jgi:hypothetical protein